MQKLAGFKLSFSTRSSEALRQSAPMSRSQALHNPVENIVLLQSIGEIILSGRPFDILGGTAV